MTVPTALTLAALLLALAVIVAAFIRSWHRVRPKTRVIVQLVDGGAIAGVLTERTGALLVIRDAKLLADQAGHKLEAPATMTGAVYVDRAKVAWVQAPEV